MNGRRLTLVAEAFTRRQVIIGAAAGIGLSLSAKCLAADAIDEISHRNESIHQEPLFKASRRRVYEVLTTPEQFQKVVRLSGAMQSSASLGNRPIEISQQVGGAFAIFGGHIVGRHIELMHDERIVQAWRVVDWNPGVYSIVKFELKEEGSATKIVFDHTGFPDGLAQHLAAGWTDHYWEPMRKCLAS